MIAAFAPATVSNVGPGFDILGFALDEPGDVVFAEPLARDAVDIVAVEGDSGRLPRDVARNTAGAAVASLRARLGTLQGVALTIHKGMPLSSGIGSSGASAVAALVAVNELWGRPASTALLLDCAMEAEMVACGAAHPDNVAPSLLGGFLLARTANPPDLVQLPVPAGLACAVLHPQMEVETRRSRAVLGDTVRLRDAVRQWGNVGALVAGLYRGDFDLIARAVEDHVAEPKRTHLVPGLLPVKRAALTAGALACTLSGAGPSIVALARSRDEAALAGEAMRAAYRAATDSDADLWISRVGAPGARIIAT